ncbi:hypothetical protein BG006_001794 [Podila minutissima]|uniref:Ion transport domain-containing protein n=1 Tax=Podila minutissima TaxID=64525 RepID=A0A9P5SAG7_9FUNG|nr:hypothetical protein BG006_001794 [Podila minutissima]
MCWPIPAPAPRVRKTHYDVVLGIATENLTLDTVEAIIITIHQKIQGSSFAKCEVITPQELRRLCLTEVQDDAGEVSTSGSQGSNSSNNATTTLESLCFRWKLHEKLTDLGEEDPVQLVMEIKTWQGESPDYGSIKLHFAEILTEARKFYMDDPLYREHRPFIHTVDLNRTGCFQLDSAQEALKKVTDYRISGDGAHILVAAVAGEHQLLQLWNFNEPPPMEPQSSSQVSDRTRQSMDSRGSLPNEPLQPRLEAWMKLPVTDDTQYELCLSWDATQFACIELPRPFVRPSMEIIEGDISNNTMFYKVETNYNTVPAGAIAGSGFRRFNPEERCPGLKNLLAGAAFHIVATQKQDVKNELFVTCDGVTIEVYSVFEAWSHKGSFSLDHSKNAPKCATDAANALRNNLRGSYLIMRDRVAHRVSTWDITRGIRQSSYTNLTYDQLENVNNLAAVSKDGKRIVVPDKHQFDIYWTETWTLVANYTFRDMDYNPTIRPFRFIRDGMQIMVSLDSQQLPLYRRNRGFILDANRGSLVEEYIAEGCDTFRMVFDNLINPRAICIGASQLSLFDVEDRIVSSPKRLKKGCSESCRSIASFEDHGLTEATAPSGLRFKTERSIVPIVVHGRREDLVVVIVTVLEENGQQTQRMSIPLPKNLKLHSATFVNKCSHLLISLNELVMIWSAPTAPQDKFALQLVHTVHRPTSCKVCPHRRVYGLCTQSEDVTVGINLDDPIPGTEAEFMAGVAHLPLIFEKASDFVQQEIIQYIGNNINVVCSGERYDSDVVQSVCCERMADTYRPTVKLWRALLAHPAGRWIPRHDMVKKNNPIFRLLARMEDHPEAFKLAEVFIDYCLRQARLEKDPHFLLPIRQCLQELTDPFKPHSEITLKMYRELAYLPVRDREAICVYYALVLIGVFMDTYHYNNEPAITCTFVFIAGLSYLLIVQEILQMLTEGRSYFQSVYNYVDLLAFIPPFVASILQITQSDPGAQNSLLSFSVLFVFLHFLFELRVIRSVCKFVSIIIHAVASIKVFFFVVVGGIIAFAVAILHLMRNCTGAIVCPSYTEGFSLNILRAISMTYFMMGGRYDAVSNGFSQDDIDFHIIMIAFFFFTVILMLNVLIGRTWELEWLQNRMRYVEGAENLSYDIPVFRKMSNYFSEMIYYTATPLQVREYRKKTKKIKEESSPIVDAIPIVGAKSHMFAADTFGDSG